MRIAMLASNYPPHPGGLEVAVRGLAVELARRHQVRVLTTAWGGLAGWRREDGLEVLRVPALHATERAGVPYPIPFGAQLREAHRIVAESDIVHAHGALYATTVLAARAARLRSRPFVLTEHVGFVPYRSRTLNRVQHAAWSLLGDRCVSRARVVVAYNTRVEMWLRDRFPETRVLHIGNGVDTVAFRPRTVDERARARQEFGLPQHEFLALFAGRQTEKKNLEAVLALPRADYRLVVCGAPRGLALDGVIDLGVVPHERMGALYACADLMINPSTAEGFPLAVQEGLASGLPLVLRWDPGYERSLDRDVAYTIDDVAGLPRAVATLRHDAGLRAKLAARGRAWAVENWDWAATARSYESAYETAVDDSARRNVSSADRARVTTAT